MTDLSVSRRSTSFAGSDSLRAQLKDSHFTGGGDKSSDVSPVLQVRKGYLRGAHLHTQCASLRVLLASKPQTFEHCGVALT